MQQRDCLWFTIEYFVSFKGFEAHDEFCAATDILLAFLLSLMSLIQVVNVRSNECKMILMFLK